jgi:hypothetical protein
VQRLSRFNGAVIDRPSMFGGGFAQASSQLRTTVRAYGYPAVVEGLQAIEDSGLVVHWATLAVSLPNEVAGLVVDHRSAAGRPDVPGAPCVADTGDLEFDLEYTAAGTLPTTVGELLVIETRTALLQRPVQRMAFGGQRLLLRTMDGVAASREVIRELCGLAGEILASTPAFASIMHADPVGFPKGITGD